MELKDPRKLELFGGGGGNGKSFKPKPRQDALGNKIPEPEEEIVILERELQELKVIFEQHFLGLDRKAPLRRRDLLGERLRRVKAADTKMSVMLRYRFDQLHSKFQTYERMWARTLNEIESGTYRRDLFKMKLRHRPPTPAVAPSAAAPPAGKTASAGPAAPDRAAPPAPAPPAGPALSEAQIKALHAAYVLAKTRTNESTEGLTVQALSKSLLKQVPELLKKYDCKAIDFKVVIKDNRAILKAVPRR